VLDASININIAEIVVTPSFWSGKKNTAEDVLTRRTVETIQYSQK
jgi:hypothetical protein